MKSFKIIFSIFLATFLAACEKAELLSADQTNQLTEASSKTPEFPGTSEFVPEVTNPFLAFERGKIFRYESETDEGLEVILVEITNDNKMIMGVTTTVVHDQAFLNGELIEDTFDWFAQDKDGNVWYFGEDTKELENGEVVSTEGSWEAGVTGEPGIIMLADPKIGVQYQQEDAPDIAEDKGKVLNLSKTVTVPFGTFTDCLQTVEWTPLEPGHREFKFYKAGVGLLLELQPRGGRGRVKLVSVTSSN